MARAASGGYALPMQQQWAADFTAKAQRYWTEERTRALVGNKRPLLLPAEAPMLLRVLGLLHRDASMPPGQVRKYRQINHMLTVLLPSLRVLRARCAKVRILDAACGRSYLSTLVAWHFKHRWKHPVEILGIDHSAALVEDSRRRTALIGLDELLRFEVAPLDGLEVEATWSAAFGQPSGPQPFHGLISLHACDTATDDAIALALAHEAEMIAVVPCCQAELAAGWAALAAKSAPGDFAPLWSGRHLSQSTGAHVTDLFRVLLLRAAGYEASAIEFVPSEHTPKNTLIRALRSSNGCPEALDQYRALKAATGGVGIGLERRVGRNALAPLEAKASP